MQCSAGKNGGRRNYRLLNDGSILTNIFTGIRKQILYSGNITCLFFMLIEKESKKMKKREKEECEKNRKGERVKKRESERPLVAFHQYG